uniref:Putative agap009967-pa-like protein n=1 Tax=Anopheles darlingi TaxID=43151 RepID=A0A2M4CK51_ANODA
MMRKLANPAGERNKDPILGVLKRFLNITKPDQQLLEVSSGVGLHSPYFAAHFPNITFQPTEYDSSLFGSIEAYRQEANLPNVLEPFFLDVSKPLTELKKESYDYMLNINMLHISPFVCAEGLFANAGTLLKPDGLLITYGPYAVNGVLTPESNVRFNESLKHRDPSWGIRDTSVLEKLAIANGITLQEMIDLPANNKCLIWKKKGA